MAGYSLYVFINCPFDDDYLEMRRALLFAVFDCGFIPRCALEENDSGDGRFAKIQRLISESKFGIHDISRTELDSGTNLPRFNMPLELGVFIGARRYGDDQQKRKKCLVLDKDRYRYQAFVSDIAGNDIMSHDSDPEKLITCVRDWLSGASGRKRIPGGRAIVQRWREFKRILPLMCSEASIEVDAIPYPDYCDFVSAWLNKVKVTTDEPDELRVV